MSLSKIIKTLGSSLPLTLALAGVLTLGSALDADAWNRGRGGGKGGWNGGGKGGWNGGGKGGWNGRRGGHKVPELDPATAGGALIVLVGGAFIAIDRRRKSLRVANKG